MTTRWLCILAAMLCCLLAVATSASAECAWVLWAQFVPSSPDQPFVSHPVGAWNSYDPCEKERAERQNRALKGKTFANFICLPDTVDPRGPKGK